MQLKLRAMAITDAKCGAHELTLKLLRSRDKKAAQRLTGTLQAKKANQFKTRTGALDKIGERPK